MKKMQDKFVRPNVYDIKLYSIYDNFITKTGIKAGNYSQSIDEKLLNTNSDDKSIEDVISLYYMRNSKKFKQYKNDTGKKCIGVLFTEVYAVGGHTPVIERFVQSIQHEYNIIGYATMTTNYQSPLIHTLVNVFQHHWFFDSQNMMSHIVKLYNQIIEHNISVIVSYIHPHDIVAAAVMCLLKKYTNIKVIYFNLADHFYNLGYKFAHLIVDARPAGQYITREIRGYNNTVLMPLQQRKIAETVYFSQKEIADLRRKIGILDGDYFTLTGGANYKMFEENSSEYFTMIIGLLECEPKLKHVIMSEFNTKHIKIIDGIFKNHRHLRKRLVIIDRVNDYDIYMQACDLFIDTFPQGGALIHLDMMRNKKPTVVKINKENPVRSFEFYLPHNYEYMYNNTNDMKNGILKLLYSENERQKASDKLSQYYLDNYEFNVVKKKYQTLIENSDNLEQFYGYSFY